MPELAANAVGHAKRRGKAKKLPACSISKDANISKFRYQQKDMPNLEEIYRLATFFCNKCCHFIAVVHERLPHYRQEFLSYRSCSL
jgi:hypothetical protein